MKKIYKRAFFAIFAAATLTSCGDFLEETSQDEFKPETVQAYQELLNGEGYSLTVNIDPITHIFTDDVQGADVSASASAEYYYTDENLVFREVYTWQPDMDQILTDNDLTGYYKSYQNLYKLIMTCNTVIEGEAKAEGTEAEHNHTRGEALALRAFYYWMLVNMYAMPYNTEGTTPDRLQGVPLVTNSEILDEGPRRSTVAAVYNRITADIEEACTLLERAKSTITGKYRINRTAAHLFASRVYLYMENWDKVIEHADKAFEGDPKMCNLNGYTLSIPSNSGATMTENATNNAISEPFPETVFVGGISGKIAIAGTLLCVSDDILALFSTDDLRKTFYFKPTPYMFYPYQEIKAGSSQREFAWRTSELYLNRAEAYAEKQLAGDASAGAKAVADINTLRRNRIAAASYTDYSPASADDLLTFIREERRRELCFENPHRWFDLRRYGMPEMKHVWTDRQGNKTVYTLEKNDVGYAMPIPVAATTANTNLEQNPLHDRRQGTTN